MISYWRSIKPFGLTYIELNAFPAYDDTYVKIKIRRYGDYVYIHPGAKDLIFLLCLLRHAQSVNHFSNFAVLKTLQNETFKYFKSRRYIYLAFSLLQHF